MCLELTAEQDTGAVGSTCIRLMKRDLNKITTQTLKPDMTLTSKTAYKPNPATPKPDKEHPRSVNLFISVGLRHWSIAVGVYRLMRRADTLLLSLMVLHERGS